jgi:hypothetical protein
MIAERRNAVTGGLSPCFAQLRSLLYRFGLRAARFLSPASLALRRAPMDFSGTMVNCSPEKLAQVKALILTDEDRFIATDIQIDAGTGRAQVACAAAL